LATCGRCHHRKTTKGQGKRVFQAHHCII
jgi:5-methylcytosine-specific restriction endonuclease McrA